MKLVILTSTAYFAGTQEGAPTGYGNTPWLNAPMNITDWGHRAVPNVLLTSAIKSGGVWNAAQYTNAALDKVIAKYLGAVAASRPAEVRGPDPDDAPQGHAGDLPVLLQLPGGRLQEGQGLPGRCAQSDLSEPDVTAVEPTRNASRAAASDARRPGASEKALIARFLLKRFGARAGDVFL